MAANYEEKEIMKPNQYDSWFNSSNTRQESEKSKLFEIKGFPFPVDRSNKKGFFYKAVNHEVIKSDLIQLLLTEPGERVMLPTFGTGLRSIVFEQKDSTSSSELRSLIIDAIDIWEPRIVVHEVTVEFGDAIKDDRFQSSSLRKDSNSNRVAVPGDNVDTNSFIVRIVYSLKEDLQGIENLVFRINYNESNLS